MLLYNLYVQREIRGTLNYSHMTEYYQGASAFWGSGASTIKIYLWNFIASTYLVNVVNSVLHVLSQPNSPDFIYSSLYECAKFDAGCIWSYRIICIDKMLDRNLVNLGRTDLKAMDEICLIMPMSVLEEKFQETFMEVWDQCTHNKLCSLSSNVL